MYPRNKTHSISFTQWQQVNKHSLTIIFAKDKTDQDPDFNRKEYELALFTFSNATQRHHPQLQWK